MSLVDGLVQSAVVLRVSRVIVKFVPSLQLPQTEAVEAQHAAAHGAAWSTCNKISGCYAQAILHHDRCRQTRKHRTSCHRGRDRAAPAGILFCNCRSARNGGNRGRDRGFNMAAC